MKQSEVAARLAIEGVVATIGGTVAGTLGITPKTLSPSQRQEAGIALDGDYLFYPVGDSGVSFYSKDAYTTVWYTGDDVNRGLTALDAAIKHYHPNARVAVDGPHATLSGWGFRGYDIKLGNGRMAVVEAAFPIAKVDDPKFSVRITAMAVKN